jgi:hypothetical protein
MGARARAKMTLFTGLAVQALRLSHASCQRRCRLAFLVGVASTPTTHVQSGAVAGRGPSMAHAFISYPPLARRAVSICTILLSWPLQGSATDLISAEGRGGTGGGEGRGLAWAGLGWTWVAGRPRKLDDSQSMVLSISKRPEHSSLVLYIQSVPVSPTFRVSHPSFPILYIPPPPLSGRNIHPPLSLNSNNTGNLNGGIDSTRL